MTSRLIFLVGALASIVLVTTTAPAMQGGVATVQETELQPPPPEASAVGATQSGLPARPQQPRTLRDHWHVFIAYAVVWALLFGYVLSLGRRFGKLERELARLRS
jgi:CcmD family protein